MGQHGSKSSIESRAIFQSDGAADMYQKADTCSTPGSVVRFQKRVTNHSSPRTREKSELDSWPLSRRDTGGLVYVMDNPTGGVWVKPEEKWSRSWYKKLKYKWFNQWNQLNILQSSRCWFIFLLWGELPLCPPALQWGGFNRSSPYQGFGWTDHWDARIFFILFTCSVLEWDGDGERRWLATESMSLGALLFWIMWSRVNKGKGPGCSALVDGVMVKPAPYQWLTNLYWFCPTFPFFIWLLFLFIIITHVCAIQHTRVLKYNILK